MKGKKTLLFAAMLVASVHVHAEDIVFEDFQNRPDARWQYVADTVMGGVSTGNVAFLSGGTGFARLTGTVSTENRGGFIQFRRKLDAPPPKGTTGIRLRVRGNGERYFVHLRTRGTLLPWQYYQSGFETGRAWTEVRLPLSSFKPSGRLLRSTPAAGSLTSIGIVAFGRDQEAQVDIGEIDFY